jgi:NAD(P)H-hydrate epimerase
MKRLDSRTIKEFGIPSRILMETAGKGCADLLSESFEEQLSKGVLILCGHGNNGGDGYVIARWLHYYGYPVCLIRATEGKSSPETAANRSLCEKLSLETVSVDMTGFDAYLEELLSDSGVVIDAVFGIGFKGSLTGKIARLIEKVNEADILHVAIDIASGLNGENGSAELAFQADLTLTMEAVKYGHLLGQGRLYSGLVEVIPIGIPDQLWEEEEWGILLDESVAYYPQSNPLAHKGDYGRIAVFAGSPGFTGAAFLASLAALKAGAGLVTLYCHPDEMLHYKAKPFEVMVRSAPLKQDGSLDKTALKKELAGYDVLLLGPGCGIRQYTYELLQYLVKHWKKPAVIDADGLNILAQHQEQLEGLRDKPFILTPHWGEFCRLANLRMENLHQDSLGILKSFVSGYGIKVLLKSHTSIYYDGQTLYFNTTGNDGLATGGSGDVLAGLTAGFLARKMPPCDAAGMAAYHLGLTAELLAEKQPTISIIPSVILDNIFKYPEVECENRQH